MTRLKAFVSNPVERPPADTPLPYVALEHIESGTGRLLPSVELGEVTDDTAVVHQAGDVRFGKLRPYLAKSLYMAEDGQGSGELLVLRPRSGLDPRFLHYLTLSEPFVEWATATAYGVKMPRTNFEAIGAFHLEPPSLQDQRRIADCLDAETARLDELISEQTHLRYLLAEHVEAEVDAAVWSHLDDAIPLGRITAPDRPIMYGIVLPGPDVAEGVLIVKGGDVRPDRLRSDSLCHTTAEIEAPYRRARLRAGDVVYSIRGSIGDAAAVPAEIDGANITQDVARISPGAGVDSKWLLYAVSSRRFFAQLDADARGATIRGINIWSLKKARVPRAPQREQVRVVEWLDRLTAEAEALDKELHLQITLLRERRQALITHAVTEGIEGLPGVA